MKVSSATADQIIIRGARQHNLKNIDIVLPRNQFVVITGLSGSGKSSLAFDTLYAEGQRRYVESLSTYARQFLERMEKPDVDLIDGLSPAIAIEQRTASHNPRSTVGTVTEIYDYLRLLFARVGTPHCYQCGQPITSQSLDQIVDQVMALAEGTRVSILAPMIMGTALAIGSGFSGAATRPTISDVVTDELCISVVARMPTMSPMNGFSVAAKNESNRPPPNDLKASLSPFTPSRKRKSRPMTAIVREIGCDRTAGGIVIGGTVGVKRALHRNVVDRIRRARHGPD